ncbi:MULTISPECIES: Mu transposase C-terminal domain-containing protein [unclassified Streptomyces]|uniref:Mu transposase C-terminal domain-containing protein n=1 Tax=unclassified Streptomyces TaxID=2593676 RepID=UPI001BEA06EB|nr:MULTISPECIES: Mu transposase C-terminal domain-containing protein [unclassified Streptomyces]MBT2407695.1 DDE-type integrase/transposase/recombinase [Streptomyces sp. ISL-21]MBT2608627.1 DDE-type integrase/transposase/recombinase [Streptomyces sp. ISL-87]
MSRAGRRRPVLAVGGHVVFESRTWQVVGLRGKEVRLVDEQGTVATLLANYLFAAADFALVGTAVPAPVPQWGLFATVPPREQERALAWQRHILEVETGLPAADKGRAPRPEYDPRARTLAQREQAKAEELTALGFGNVARTTVQRMRLSYRAQGLWGLVDHRTTRTSSRTGRNDERVIAAVLEAMRRQHGRSQGTVKGLRQLTVQILEEAHGPGTVKMPAHATFYRLANALADPHERPGTPARPYTPTRVLRAGEQVMLDTTRLDVLAVFDNGTTGRPELTIALDVASRSILAAVLRPAGTKAVDAALLLAEMATPHPMRPIWPDALHLSRAPVPYDLLLDADTRLHHAAARPVAVPETVVVDRGRVFVSEAFLAAAETLGISVQPAPPRQPAAKGPVERTFGSINTLLCQHIAGHTGSDPTRRGRGAESEAMWTVPQLQDILDQWITTGWQNRPHQGLRHPTMPATALTPNEMWGSLLGTCGHVPLPLTSRDYVELLPVRWKRITERGIRIDHRTYDHHTLNPHRGRPSGITAQQGRWEVHHNPHDHRQIWVRLPDGQFTTVPWIHTDHVHAPFGDDLWQHLKTTVERRGDRDRHEADLAQALDDLLRRVRTGTATTREQHLAARHAPAALPHHHNPASPDTAGARPEPGTHSPLPRPRPATTATRADTPHDQDHGGQTADSLDDTDPDEDEDEVLEYLPGAGFGLYDARKEAELW